MKTEDNKSKFRGMASAPAALRGARQRLVRSAGNSLISRKDNQNCFLRAAGPLSNARGSRSMSGGCSIRPGDRGDAH